MHVHAQHEIAACSSINLKRLFVLTLLSFFLASLPPSILSHTITAFQMTEHCSVRYGTIKSPLRKAKHNSEDSSLEMTLLMMINGISLSQLFYSRTKSRIYSLESFFKRCYLGIFDNDNDIIWCLLDIGISKNNILIVFFCRVFVLGDWSQIFERHFYAILNVLKQICMFSWHY